MFLLMLVSLAVAFFWDKIPFVKEGVNLVLNPTAGKLLNWNVDIGIILITAILIFISSLLQKYKTDQNLLKNIKEQQKIIQQEIKLYKDNPEKTMELSKKSFELTMQALPITMRPAMYTIIPFVLFLRWFNDYFSGMHVKIFGFLSGIWAYIIFSLIWSVVWKKVLKIQ